MAIDTAHSRPQPSLPFLPFFVPYLNWAFFTEFRYYGNWLPVLFELSIPAREFAVGKLAHGGTMPDGWQDWLRIPEAYANPPLGLEDYRFCTAWVRIKMSPGEGFNALGSSLSDTIVSLQIGAPGNVPKPAPALKTHKKKKKPHHPHHGAASVVTAAIDDGIAFAHERFRRADGTTRFAYFWDQNGTAGVAGFGFGHDSTGAEIDAATGNGTTHEDRVYADLGYVDYATDTHQALGRRISHGTLACDVAFGLDAATVAAGTLPMVGVRLEDIATRDTSGNHLKLPVIDALIYVLLRADDIAHDAGSAPMPVVATLSYGYIAGPHDGCSPFERAIDFILQLRSQVAPMRLVLPSGNWYLARCHAEQPLPPTQAIEPLRWRILPDDATGTFMEIWVRASNAASQPQVELRVTDPTGQSSGWLSKGQNYAGHDAQNRLQWTADNPAVAAGQDRAGLLLWVAPTTITLNPIGVAAPSGTYVIEVREVAGVDCTVHAWVQRDDTPIGYPIRGRQSHFDDPAYVRYDPVSGRPEEDDNQSYVKRYGSISAMATSNSPIVIGGFRRSDRVPVRYSAAGPANGGGIGCGTTRLDTDPDAIAVTEDSVARHGVLGAGSRSSSVVAMNGTSVAAPQIARLVWGELRKRHPGDRNFVAQLAETEKIAMPNPKIPTERAGHGRITVETVAPAAPFPGAQTIRR